MFISKSCKKAVPVQLKDHVRNNNLDELFQSAYKAGHSTETALLRVQNDVLRAIDNGGCVMLLNYWISWQHSTRSITGFAFKTL